MNLEKITAVSVSARSGVALLYGILPLRHCTAEFATRTPQQVADLVAPDCENDVAPVQIVRTFGWRSWELREENPTNQKTPTPCSSEGGFMLGFKGLRIAVSQKERIWSTGFVVLRPSRIDKGLAEGQEDSTVPRLWDLCMKGFFVFLISISLRACMAV